MQGAHQSPSQHQRKFAALLAASCAALAGLSIQAAELKPEEIRIVFAEGSVEFSQAGATDWQPAGTNNLLREAYRLRTGERSRAMLLWADRAAATIGESTVIEILAADAPKAPSGVHLWRGLLSFFHRDEPGRFPIMTRSSMAGTEGTEFVVAVDPANDATTLSVIDGKVSFSNPQGTLTLTNLEQAVAELGQPPRRTPGFIVNHVLQWSFYYPGVLDADELPLTATERQTLADSLAAYRDGDLLDALEKYPANRQPESAAERVYHAALLLAVGLAEKSEAALALMEPATADVRTMRPAGALRLLIAVVKNPVGTRSTASLTSLGGPDAMDLVPTEMATATEALALSYYEQSRAIREESLQKALAAARRATELSPNFGFAWARVAELEFSFGRTREARQAVERSLALSPRNAQALALQGFLLAAQNKTRAALDYFDQAIAIDPALGNAWLGRGLCKIRLTPDFFSLAPIGGTSRSEGMDSSRSASRNSQSAMDDLLIAAAVEPQRSLLRSYLGKAWSLDHRNSALAHKELGLAMRLDPADPTPWLYRALLNQQENRINEGIRDLEKSQDLNDNRRVDRSQLKLDEDRAVRGVNLAGIYRDAGLIDVSVSEAAEALASDYVNYSGHLVLANSYNERRDPSLNNLRYETATFSEYLVGNLLAPVSGSRLSPHVSQQEYLEFFEQDRLGLSSQTLFLSRGDWQQQTSQYGWLKNTAYAVDFYYRTQAGERPNHDLEQRAASLQWKQQLTPEDSLYFQAIVSDFEAGDVRQLYDARSASRALRINDEQVPNLFAGYHHKWSPGLHTLLLASRLEDRFSLSDANVLLRGVARDNAGTITNTLQGIARNLNLTNNLAANDTFDALNFRSEFEAYSIELQQMVKHSAHTLILGARYQDGRTRTHTTQRRSRNSFLLPDTIPSTDFVAGQEYETTLSRFNLYGYEQWQLTDALWLTAGLSYDALRYPRNVDSPPIAGTEQTKEQLSPKAGFIWKPATDMTFSGAYTRSLGGLFFDASVRLEPVQISGFNQAYRSLVPASEGTLSGAQFETFDLGFKGEFGTGTYLIIQAENLQTKGSRDQGVFDYDPVAEDYTSSSQIRQALKFEEQSLLVSLSQLVGRDWAFGARYQISQAQLISRYPGISDALIADTRLRAVLHQLNLQAIFNHPSGFFAEVHSLWRHQNNFHYEPKLPGDDFWQFNLLTGYRLARRRAEITVGLLNVTSQDYRLNSLNLYQELPRERTLLVSLSLNF